MDDRGGKASARRDRQLLPPRCLWSAHRHRTRLRLRARQRPHHAVRHLQPRRLQPRAHSRVATGAPHAAADTPRRAPAAQEGPGSSSEAREALRRPPARFWRRAADGFRGLATPCFEREGRPSGRRQRARRQVHVPTSPTPELDLARVGDRARRFLGSGPLSGPLPRRDGANLRTQRGRLCEHARASGVFARAADIGQCALIAGESTR